MQAKIITIGDEILVGQTVDTNSAFIAKELNTIGIKVSEIVSITDTSDHITKALDNSINNNKFVILTGGLGPTNDDITKKTLSDYFNDKLIEYPEVLAKVKGLFERFNKPFLEVNRDQAMLPEKARIIENDHGTASGMWFKKGETDILSLPGVPYEMKGLFNKFVDLIKTEYNVGNFYHQTLMVAGIGETYFAQKIKQWEDQSRNEGITVSYLPSVGALKLRLTGTLEQKDFIDRQIAEIRDAYPKYVVGGETDTLERKIGELLNRKQLSVGTVESCTGGGIANRITAVPGASAYFQGSIISYSNDIKVNTVGVSEDTLKLHGAVSEEVVIEMANHGKEKLGVDYCISVSGIAGPDGGTNEKPVGLVWIAIATPETTYSKAFNFGHNRSRNIESAINASLNFLRVTLISE